jgi:3-mercaptopyruvate sulfurtransferase SseA
MSKMFKEKRGREALIGLLGATTIFLAGCSGTENDLNTSSASPLVVEATPASLASESADNYDDNNYGLITAPTLKRWVDDWPNNRPEGITGKLVILQVASGPVGYEFIKPNGTDVFTYQATEWVETRSNGVVTTKSMVPSGYSMDAFLSKYDVDPATDMIVCGMGTGGTGQAMQAGRCWYMFRYWGAAKENLAVLNGGNKWNGENTALDASYFSSTATTPTWAGRASVKDLPEINFALQATLEDMMNIVPPVDSNLLDDGVFIWDARSTNQYSPTVDADFQSGPVQGHPNGALVLPYNNLLDSAAGYNYKAKADIQAYMDGGVDANTISFADSTLQGVGAGNAYQQGDIVYTYCETTYRAMITGFASVSILGLPTRFYDGAMTEWHSLSNVNDDLGVPLLAINSPWRTDKVAWSMFIEKTVPVAAPADESSSGYINDAYAASANAIIDEDKAYKGFVDSSSTTTTSTSTGSTGGGLPPNPCGG